jgi:hypothetical protein
MKTRVVNAFTDFRQSFASLVGLSGHIFKTQNPELLSRNGVENLVRPPNCPWASGRPIRQMRKPKIK